MAAADGTPRPSVVVGVDGSPSSQAAYRWAVRQARLTGGAVKAVTAWHHPTAYGYPVPIAPLSNAREIAERVLRTATDEVAQQAGGPVDITGRVVEGNAASVLLAESRDAEMLVVGSRGYGGFARALLGSTGQHCVQHARCPVVVVRGQEGDPDAGATSPTAQRRAGEGARQS